MTVQVSDANSERLLSKRLVGTRWNGTSFFTVFQGHETRHALLDLVWREEITVRKLVEMPLLVLATICL